MFILQWFADDLTRTIDCSIICLCLFAIVQFLLCFKLKNKILKLIPLIFPIFLTVVTVVMGFGLVEYDDPWNLKLLLSGYFFGIPALSMYLGIILGYLGNIITKALLRKRQKN